MLGLEELHKPIGALGRVTQSQRTISRQETSLCFIWKSCLYSKVATTLYICLFTPARRWTGLVASWPQIALTASAHVSRPSDVKTPIRPDAPRKTPCQMHLADNFRMCRA